jgi:hypothetical protein
MVHRGKTHRRTEGGKEVGWVGWGAEESDPKYSSSGCPARAPSVLPSPPLSVLPVHLPDPSRVSVAWWDSGGVRIRLKCVFQIGRITPPSFELTT